MCSQTELFSYFVESAAYDKIRKKDELSSYESE